MVHIKAKKVPRRVENPDDLIARFCYYYPQYTFTTAKKRVPLKRIVHMINVARKEQALLLYNITEAIAAPHTKKGQGVTSLLNKYKKIIES